MHHHHGVLAQDGRSLDGKSYLARDTITIDDDGDQGALMVTNHRTHQQMLIPLTSACWIPSHAESRPGNATLLTPYGESLPLEDDQASTTRRGRRAIQVSLGSALDVRRILVSDEDLSTKWARSLPPFEQNVLFSWQWREITSLRQAPGRDDSSDGGLSTGSSSPSSIRSPVTPLSVARNDSAIDLGSLDASQDNKKPLFKHTPGSIDAGSFSSDQLPGSSLCQPDISTLYHPFFGMQDACNPAYSLFPYGVADEAGMLNSMARNNVQVNYMHAQDQPHQMPAPTNAESSPNAAWWNPSVPVSNADWQAAYAPPGYATTVNGSGHPEQAGLAQHLPASIAITDAYQQPQTLRLSTPHHHLAPGQRSLTNQSWASFETDDAAAAPVFYRAQEQHTMNLTASTGRTLAPRSSSVGSRPPRSQAAPTAAASREPEPESPPDFRPDLVLYSFRHRIRPDVDVLQRAQGNATDDKPGAKIITDALQLVQSTVDETISVLETLRPSTKVGDWSQQRVRNDVDHILASIQAIRQSATSGRELTEEETKAPAKHIKSLKSYVQEVSVLYGTDVVVPRNHGSRQANSGTQPWAAGPQYDLSQTGGTVAHPTAATTALGNFHWGQTTPPPDQPPRMPIGHGQQQHAAFMHGMPSHNLHQAVTGLEMHGTAVLSGAAPLPGFDPSGCGVDPVLSGVTHSAMAPVLSPSTGPGPVTPGGWPTYAAAHPAVLASPGSTFPPQQQVPMGHHMNALYHHSPPQAAYGENLASMYETTQGPLQSHLAMPSPTASSPVQASDTGATLAAHGTVMALGPSTDAQLFPVSMMPPVSSGRRGSVPDRRLPHRERNRIAPYPADYRSFRKGSV